MNHFSVFAIKKFTPWSPILVIINIPTLSLEIQLSNCMLTTVGDPLGDGLGLGVGLGFWQ